jgi:hypothetical protein
MKFLQSAVLLLAHMWIASAQAQSPPSTGAPAPESPYGLLSLVLVLMFALALIIGIVVLVIRGGNDRQEDDEHSRR